nr:ribonuclease H-like domain-containing protein [Tanacetum cinerariifolium]
MVPTAMLTQSKPILTTAVRPVSVAMPKINVTRPRYAHPIVTKSKSLVRRHITCSQSPKTSNSSLRDTTVPALVVSAAQGNLVRGLPTKVFENDHTCVACKKGKQHRASCKTKPVSSVNQPLYRLHMDLFGPTFVKSLNKKSYCLVVTDDYSSVPRTPQQNGIAERKNITLIEDARTTLVDSLLPIPFWVENPYCSETLHVNFLENKPNVTSSGPTWLFDIDNLTRTMNYQPVMVENQTNPNAGFQDKFDAEKAGEEIDQQYVLFLVWYSGSTNPQNYNENAAFDEKEHDFDAKKHESEVILSPCSSAQSRKQDDKTKKEAKGKSHVESFT